VVTQVAPVAEATAGRISAAPNAAAVQVIALISCTDEFLSHRKPHHTQIGCCDTDSAGTPRCHSDRTNIRAGTVHPRCGCCRLDAPALGGVCMAWYFTLC